MVLKGWNAHEKHVFAKHGCLLIFLTFFCIDPSLSTEIKLSTKYLFHNNPSIIVTNPGGHPSKNWGDTDTVLIYMHEICHAPLSMVKEN